MIGQEGSHTCLTSHQHTAKNVFCQGSWNGAGFRLWLLACMLVRPCACVSVCVAACPVDHS